MPRKAKAKPITLQPDDIAALFAFMTIEIVTMLADRSDQALTDIANRMLETSGKVVIPERAIMLRAIAASLISTEDSGLE